MATEIEFKHLNMSTKNDLDGTNYNVSGRKSMILGKENKFRIIVKNFRYSLNKYYII